jgi:L-alanine-DL-glutamate epimerase-like enolase superfamily enzyme
MFSYLIPAKAAEHAAFREARRDIELAQAIRHEFPHIDLMIDPVCAYTSSCLRGFRPQL